MIQKYINPEVLNRLVNIDPAALDPARIEALLAKYLRPHKNKEFIAEVLSNRLGYVSNICEALNTNNIRIIMLGGMLGSGKSSIIKTAIAFTNINVTKFWYECSKVSTLDDIYVSLYSFLQKYIGKEERRYDQQKQSVDEKVISYLNHLKTPLIFTLDNIEFLLNNSDAFENTAIKSFIDFLISNQNIKIILAGQRLPTMLLQDKPEALFKTRILGFEQTIFETFLQKHLPQLERMTADELYEYSRGYPWILLLTTAVIKHKFGNVQALITNYKTQDLNFETFLCKELFLSLNPLEKQIVSLVACIRHHVTQEGLFTVCKEQTLSEKHIADLLAKYLLQGNIQRFYVNTTVREAVLSAMPNYDLYKAHRLLKDFYDAESFKKLQERILRLSRRSIDEEKNFHEDMLKSLEKASAKIDSDRHLAINYMPRSMLDALYWGNIISNPDKEEEKPDAQEEKAKLSIEDERAYMIKKSSRLDKKSTQEEINIDLNTIDKLDDPEFINQYYSDLLVEESGLAESSQGNSFALDTSSELPNQMEPASQIDILIQQAKDLAKDKKWSEAVDKFLEALNCAKEHSLHSSIQEILNLLVDVYLTVKNNEKAVECLKEIYTLCQNTYDTQNAAQTLGRIGEVYKISYKHDLALDSFFHLLSEFKEKEAGYETLSKVYAGIAEIYDYRSQLYQAKEYYLKALDYCENLGDETTIADLLAKIGLLYDDLRDLKNAVKYYTMALQKENKLNRKDKLADLLTNMAAVMEETGQKKEAAVYYRKSLALDKQSANDRGVYHTYGKLGNLYSELEEYAIALKCYRNELNIAKKLRNPIWIGMSYIDLGDLYYFLQQYYVAAKHFASAEYYLGNAITTDSKEKLERRITSVVSKIGRAQYQETLESMKKYHTAT